MTPPERASYLIKEYDLNRAIDHCNWVIKDCEKDLTRDYWKQVRDELIKRMEYYSQQK